MGGKAADGAGRWTHPETVRRLVVADIAPVAYGHTQQPLIDAMRAVDLSLVERRGDADAQLAPRVSEAGVRAFLLQSLDVGARRWRLNLDALSANMAAILGWPDLDGRYDGPALFSVGGPRRIMSCPSIGPRSRRCSRTRNSPRSPARAIGSTPRSPRNSRPPCALFSARPHHPRDETRLPDELMHGDRADMGDDQQEQNSA